MSDAAFYAASSGIEHAKFAIARSESLGLPGREPFVSDAGGRVARAQRLDNGDTVGSNKDMPANADRDPRDGPGAEPAPDDPGAVHSGPQTDNVQAVDLGAGDGIQIGAFFDGIPAMPTCGRVYSRRKDSSHQHGRLLMACASVEPGRGHERRRLSRTWPAIGPDSGTWRPRPIGTDPGNKIQR